MADKREFTVKLVDGKEVKLTTRNPNNKEIRDAEYQYSRAFNEAILAGIVPQSTLVDALLANGVWSAEKDDAIEAQRKKVIELEQGLIDCKDDIIKPNLAKELAAERDVLYSLRQKRNDLVSHSAESKADDAQRNYIVSQVTELAGTSRPVWKNFTEFMNEKDGGLVFRAVYEYMTFLNGLSSDFTNQLPENAVTAAEPAKADPPVATPAV